MECPHIALTDFISHNIFLQNHPNWYTWRFKQYSKRSGCMGCQGDCRTRHSDWLLWLGARTGYSIRLFDGLSHSNRACQANNHRKEHCYPSGRYSLHADWYVTSWDRNRWVADLLQVLSRRTQSYLILNATSSANDVDHQVLAKEKKQRNGSGSHNLPPSQPTPAHLSVLVILL